MRATLSLFITLAATAASAEVWVPIIPVQPRPVIIGGPIVVVPAVPAIPSIDVPPNSMTPVMVPAQLGWDGIARLQRITHFEVVVGPGSTDRGCEPKEGTGDPRDRDFTGVVAPKEWKIDPTRLVDTYRRTMSDGKRWTVYQFLVNDGIATPVSQVNVFMKAPARRGSFCSFQVNVANREDARAPAAAYGAPPEGVARAAAPAVVDNKIPRVESIQEEKP